MKHILILISILAVQNFAFSQNFNWVNYLVGGGANHAVFDVHVPPGSNYSYACGRYRNTTTFYGQDTNVVDPYHEADRDVYIAKIDSNGNYVWIVTDGGPDSDYPNGICTDENGNVYIAGTFEQSAYFDQDTIVGDVAGDVFVAKYDENGVFQWVKPFGGLGTGWEWAQEIECDLNGNIYVGGYQDGDFVCGSDTLPDRGYFVMKMDYAGNVEWCKGPTNAAASSASWVWGMKYHEGKLFFSGTQRNTVTFDTILINAFVWHDGYIARMDLDGDIEHVISFGGVYYDDCHDIEIKDSIIYAVGSYSNHVNFDTIPMYAPVVGSGGGDALKSRDAFLAKFKYNGDCIWVKDIKGDYIDQSHSVLINKKGNIVITGSYDQININSSSGAYGDILIREYDPDGNLNWELKPVGANLGEGMAIEEDDNGNYFFGGKVKGDHYFQNIFLPLPNIVNHTAIMVRIYPPIGIEEQDTVSFCKNDTIWLLKPDYCGSPTVNTWDAGSATVIFENEDSIQIVSNNEDSILYIVSNSFEIDTAIYHLKEWNLPQSGLSNNFDTCDTVVTLNAGSDAILYNWGTGLSLYDSLLTISSTGNYYVTLQNSNGCLAEDSVMVTFFPSAVVDLGTDTSTCEGLITLNAGSGGELYDWGAGNTPHDSILIATQTGLYRVIVETIDGCITEDSVQLTFYVPLTLNLGPDTNTCENQIIINAGAAGTLYNWGTGFILNDSTHVVNTSGTYIVIAQTNDGCTGTDTIVVNLLDCTSIDDYEGSIVLNTYFDYQNQQIVINEASGNVFVEIYDLTGKRIVISPKLGSQTIYKLPILASGSYIAVYRGEDAIIIKSDRIVVY